MTRGVTKRLLTGQIDTVDFDLIGRKITVTGRDKSAKLHDKKSSEKWLNKKTTDIVKELAERAGMKVGSKDLGTIAGKMLEQDYVKLSDNVSFAYVIHKLAELDGARWWVDADGVFHYVPFNSPSGVYSIFIDQSSQPIKSDCLHLRIRHNVQAGRDIEVHLKAWHPKKKKVIQHKSVIKGNGAPITYNYNIPILQQDQVEKHARSQAMEKARHELSVRASVVGDPTVAVGMGLSVTGTTQYDQTYDIDTVHHDFGMRGHTTHITARNAKEGRTAS
jgi:prophage tail gpP-like protein